MNPQEFPDVVRYLELARHDAQVLDSLTEVAALKSPQQDVSDWQVTLLFYVCCISVKAVGRALGRSLHDHYEVRQFLNTEQRLLLIARPYRHIEEASRNARYEGERFDRAFFRNRLAPHFRAVWAKVVEVLTAEGVLSIGGMDPVVLR